MNTAIDMLAAHGHYRDSESMVLILDKSLCGSGGFRGPLGLWKRTVPVQVPLNSLDLSHVSILYTQGEMAAITPIYVSLSQACRNLRGP